MGEKAIEGPKTDKKVGAHCQGPRGTGPKNPGPGVPGKGPGVTAQLVPRTPSEVQLVPWTGAATLFSFDDLVHTCTSCRDYSRSDP